MSDATTLRRPQPMRPQERVGRPTVLALAKVEARRTMLHPLMLAGTLLTGLALGLSFRAVPDIAWPTEAYEMLGSNWFPLYGATFVVANLAALRERESTTSEAFSAVPAGRLERTAALLLAAAGPTALAVVLAAYSWTLIVRIDGIPAGSPHGEGQVVPSLVELCTYPATTAAAFAAGVAVARTVRSRAFGALLGGFSALLLNGVYWLWLWFPAAFLVPHAVAARSTTNLGLQPSAGQLQKYPLLDQPDEYDANWHVVELEPARVGWHATYMLGVALLLAAYSMARSGGHPRVKWLFVAGTLLAVAGVTLQVLSTGQSFSWFESTSEGG